MSDVPAKMFANIKMLPGKKSVNITKSRWGGNSTERLLDTSSLVSQTILKQLQMQQSQHPCSVR